MLTKAFGLFGPVLGIASVCGPVLAGFIISADLFGLSWRPIFLINVILGAVGLVVAAKILPRDDGDRSTVVDGWGSGLLAAAMFGLLYGLIEGSTNGWKRWSRSPRSSPASCSSPPSPTASGPRPTRSSRPRCCGTGASRPACSSAWSSSPATTGLLYVLSLFIQEGLHAGPRDAALALAPLTLGIIISAFAAMGGLVAKLGRTLVFLGLAIVLAGCGWVLALVATSGTDVGLWSLAPALFVHRHRHGLLLQHDLRRRPRRHRTPTKPAAPTAHSARSSSSPRASARPRSPRSSSRPRRPGWATP